MIKKVLVVVCCLAVAFVAWSGWSSYQNKQRFEDVRAEYAKEQPAHR
jgi:predicted negative regulator of RcsB-dependent stress response